MYNVVYKCRLCGGIVEVPIRDYDAKVLSDRIIGITDPYNSMYEPKQIHKCKNGSRGIMDI